MGILQVCRNSIGRIMERERILNTEGGHQKGKVPARNLLSDEISRDLKRRDLNIWARLPYILIYRHAELSTITGKSVFVTMIFWKIIRS